MSWGAREQGTSQLVGSQRGSQEPPPTSGGAVERQTSGFFVLSPCLCPGIGPREQSAFGLLTPLLICAGVLALEGFSSSLVDGPLGMLYFFSFPWTYLCCCLS